MKIQFFNNFPKKEGFNCHLLPLISFGYNNNIEIKNLTINFYQMQIGWLFWFINITKNIKNEN